MRLIFSHRNFALLWWAGLLSIMGNWALQVALPVYIYEQTGSALATSLMFAATTLPRILFASVAGIYVDRWNRKQTLVITNLLLGIGLLPLLLVSGPQLLWLIYLIAFCQAVLSQFSNPAENALLPMLVESKWLMPANAMNALNNNLARLMGPALGGLLVASMGLKAVVIYDAATFLFASFLIAFIQLPKNVEANQDTELETHKSSLLREWLAGFRIIRQNRTVSILFSYIALTALGEGVMAALFIPFVVDVLQGGSLAVGWLMSAQAIGGILGGFVIAVIATQFAPVQLLGWGSVGVGLIDFIIFNYSTFLSGISLGIILFALAGLPVSALQAGHMTIFQEAVKDRYRGRVFGNYETTMALTKLIGIGLGGWLGDLIGIVSIINTQAVVYFVGGLLVLILLRNYSTRLEK